MNVQILASKSLISENKIGLRRYILLCLVFCSISAATERLYSDIKTSPHGNCLNPDTGVGNAINLKQNIEYGKRYMKLHMVDSAIPCLENAHSEDPNGFSIAYDLGLAFLQTGNTQAAHALIEHQLTLQNNADLQDLLGTIETKQRNYSAASIQYQLAAQQDPSEQNIFDFGTSLLQFEGNAADKIFRYGISKYPNSVRLHVGLGSALYAQGESTQAAEEMCVASRIDPSDPHPMEMIGETEQIPPSLSIEITTQLSNLVRLYPQNGRLLYDYAMALSGIWSGRISTDPQVVAFLHRAVILDAHLTKAYFYLAQIEEQEKHYKEAVENYRKASDLSPTNDQYIYRLAFAYKETGDDRMFQKELRRFRIVHEKMKKTE